MSFFTNKTNILILTVLVLMVLVFIIKCVYMGYDRVKYYTTLYEGDDQNENVSNKLTKQNDGAHTLTKANEDIQDTLSSQGNNSLRVFSDIHGCVNNNLQNGQSNSEVEKIDGRVESTLSNKVKSDDLIIFEDVNEDINDRSADENACREMLAIIF